MSDDNKIHLDVETRSTLPFGRSKGAVTAYQYASHPTTELLWMCYAIGDGDVKSWTPFDFEPFPEELIDAVRAKQVMGAHNSGFEWVIWNYLMRPRYGVPFLPFDQTDCTAARAAVMALPRSLEDACKAMGLEVEKDMQGSKLMQQMAKPRKARKHEDPTRVYWWEDAERMERLRQYCVKDVEAERALDKALRPFCPVGREQWLLVHETNMRGIQMDVDLAKRAQKVMRVVEQRYCDELDHITQGQVHSATEVAGMKQWLQDAHGMILNSLDKTSILNLLEQDLPDDARRVLQIRQEAGKSSVAKLQRFIELTGEDGRMRENFMYHGAATGRLSGKGAQCVTGDHEVLTRTGWQRIDSVGAKVEMMQWGPNDESVSMAPCQVKSYGKAGLLARIDSRMVKGRFTLDHRIPVLCKGEVTDTTPAEVLKVGEVRGVLDYVNASRLHQTTITRDQITVEHSEEEVFCPTTPGGYWLCRYQGHLYLTGNCQNLPSRTGIGWREAEDVIDIIKGYPPEPAAETVELIHGDVPMSVSSCLRAHLTVRPGKTMYVADFSNIEGRVACWFGGEDWKIQAFKDYDTFILDDDGNKIPDGKGGFLRVGPDLYKVTAAQILGTTPDKIDKTRRNVMGKVPELALGFEGGAGAFQSMAAIYNVNMADYWDIIRDSLDSKFVRKAYDHWELFGSRSGMDHEAWLASETVKLAWRDRHPGIAQCWKDCERNAIKALQNPGRWFRFADNRLAFGAKEIAGVMFLIGRLPSGRLIYKAHASLKVVNQFGRDQAKIHYMGVDSITRRWVRMTTYSGDLFQSFVQGCAYDMMMSGWANVEKAGYEVILSVHDEIGAEADPGRPVEEFERLMSDLPAWADGCPVSAEGYVADRYRKDD